VSGAVELVAICGPTAVGKTSVAIALAETLRERGEDPVAVSCDAIQLYRGLELISGAPTAAQRAALEHRLVGIAEPSEEFSAGRFAELAEAEIAGPVLTDVNLELGERGEGPVEIRTAVRSGPVVAGAIGAAPRWEYAAIGTPTSRAVAEV